MRCLLIAAALSLLAPTAPRAQVGGSTVFGYGLTRCSDVTAVAQPGSGFASRSETIGLFVWMAGYISGFNSATSLLAGKQFQFSAKNAEVAWTHAVQFCRDEPAKEWFDAVTHAMTALPFDGKAG